MVSLSRPAISANREKVREIPRGIFFHPLSTWSARTCRKGVVQYQPAELLFRRDPQQLLVFLIPAGDKMALVALLHDLSVQITGQLLIQEAMSGFFRAKLSMTSRKLSSRNSRRNVAFGLRAWLARSVITRSVSAGMFRRVYVTLSPPSFVMSCSFSLIPRTFSCEGALLQYLYSILVLSVFKYCEAYVFIIRMLRCLFSVHFLF